MLAVITRLFGMGAAALSHCVLHTIHLYSYCWAVGRDTTDVDYVRYGGPS